MEKKQILVSLAVLVLFVGVTSWLTNKYMETKLADDAALAANTNINAQVNAGTLSISAPATATMTAIDLDSIADTGGTSTGTITGVVVKDHRSASPGWSATATCSNFTSGTNTIPVTKLTLTPSAITAIGNSSLTGVSAGTAHTFTSITDATTLMSATATNGRGRYSQSEGLSLSVDVSTVPGTYTATITETVA